MPMCRSSFALGTALAAMMAISASAQTVTLRASYWVANTAMPAPVWEDWLRSMEKASEGQLKIQIFPAGQLGKANDHYDMARDGIADLAWSVPGFNAGRFPIFGALELPLIISNAPEGVHVFDTWYRKHAAAEMADVHFCLTNTSPISTLNFSAKQVRMPEEMKGIRIRPQNAVAGRFFAKLGANVVQVSAAEAKQAFDRGIIDGIAFPWRTLVPFSLHTSVKYHMDMPLTTAPSAWVMNKDFYAKLPPKAKAAVDSHCTPEWARKIIKAWDDWEAEGRDLMVKQGNTIYAVDDAARAAWKKAADDFHVEWIGEASKKGIDAKAELAGLKAAFAAVKAGF